MIRRRTLKEGIASDFESAAEKKYPGYSRRSSEAEPIIDKLANRFVDLQATSTESAEAAIDRVLDENEREIRNNLEALAGFFLIGDHFDPEGDNEDLYLDVRDLLADLLAEFATDGLDESAGKWHITVDGKEGGKLFDTLSSAKRTAEKMRERGEDGTIEIRKTDDDDFRMKLKTVGNKIKFVEQREDTDMIRRRRLFESGRRDRINAIRGSIEKQASFAKSAQDALLKKREALAEELVGYETSEIEKLAPRAVELLKDYIDVWRIKRSKLEDYFYSERGEVGGFIDVSGDGHFYIRAVRSDYKIYFDFQGNGKVMVFDPTTETRSLESWINGVVWEDIDPNTDWEANDEDEDNPILIKVDERGAKRDAMEYIAFVNEVFDAFAAEVEAAIDRELDRLEGSVGR